jgi:hypothetical protein
MATFAQNAFLRSVDRSSNAADMERARQQAFKNVTASGTSFANPKDYQQALFDSTQSIFNARNTPQNSPASIPVVTKPSDIPESVFSGANAAADRRFNPPLFNNPQQPFGTPASTPYSISQMPFGNPPVPYNSFSPLASKPDVGTSGFSRTIGGFGDQAGKVNTTEQILSPSGFVSSTFTPDQLNQRAQARQQAQQSGTMPRTPEQQQALLAQMRTRGAAIGRDILNKNEEVFAAKRQERKLANSSGLGIGSDYYKSQPSSIASIQRDFKNYQGAGVDKMTDFVQSMIRKEAASKKKSKPAPSSQVLGNARPTSYFGTPNTMTGFYNPLTFDLTGLSGFNGSSGFNSIGFPQGMSFGGY